MSDRRGGSRRRLWLSALYVGVSACLFRLEGTSVEVELTPPLTRDIVRDDGTTIVLTSALVTVSSLEVIGDEDTTAVAASALALFSPIATAHAHGESGPTRLGATTAIDLLGPAINLGNLAPDSGVYREVVLELAPADDDAVGIEDHPELQGRTLVLEGKLVGASGEDLGPFYLSTSTTTEVSVFLEGADPIVVSAEQRRGRLVLSLDPAGWFDGVDPRVPTVGAEVLAKVAASMSGEFAPESEETAR